MLTIYLTAYASFSAAGLYDGWRMRRAWPLLVATAIADLVLVLFAAAALFPAMSLVLAPIAKPLFAGATAWLLMDLARDLRQVRRATGESERAFAITLTLGIALVLAMILPLWWLGFKGAVLGG